LLSSWCIHHQETFFQNQYTVEPLANQLFNSEVLLSISLSTSIMAFCFIVLRKVKLKVSLPQVIHIKKPLAMKPRAKNKQMRYETLQNSFSNSLMIQI